MNSKDVSLQVIFAAISGFGVWVAWECFQQYQDIKYLIYGIAPAVMCYIMLGACYRGLRYGHSPKKRGDFYRQRKKDYIDALPARYPYIVGFDGVDNDDLAVIQTGPRSQKIMDTQTAIKQGIPIHPSITQGQYKGDGYRSTKQMRGDFK